MASFYQAFTSTRTTAPDAPALVAALRSAVAPEVGVQVVDSQHYILKKATAWVAGDLSSAQAQIDVAAAQSGETIAQHNIDGWPIEVKALALTLLDQINVIRAALPVPLPAITPAQVIAAIRTKAGTL